MKIPDPEVTLHFVQPMSIFGWSQHFEILMYSDEEEGRVGGWVEERKERKVQPSTQEENSRFPYASFSYLYLVVFHLDEYHLHPSFFRP